MYQLKTKAAFDSAHFLSGYQGKCANLHGHRWTVEVMVEQENLQTEGVCRGMLIDFGDLKTALRQLAAYYDHALIYEEGSLRQATVQALQEEQFRLIAVPFRPTAECFAKHFFQLLQHQNLPVKQVVVYETPDNYAAYEEA
ncbi:MAG: 6-carboxytetrahydropterin synthase QueD [Oscillospiraceae bacterium]|nr:6-carboxytetrahydropterin synthase QueD [Oscillospiraceae bacterium]